METIPTAKVHGCLIKLAAKTLESIKDPDDTMVVFEGGEKIKIYRFGEAELLATVPEPERKRWMSAMPTDCEVCGVRLETGFVNGRIKVGSGSTWYIACIPCFTKFGIGLGLGKGQQYDKDGYKVAR